MRRLIPPVPILALGASLALYPFDLSAQAICSAPHSSPTLAQSGSLRTLPPGGGWVQVAAYGQRAARFFDPNGDRRPFLASSEFGTRSFFLTGAIGITKGVEFWAQLPIHRLEVESAGGNSTAAGLGDGRGAVRIGPEIIGLEFPVSLRLGAKFPGSEFPVDATVLPLTEGQRDWEASVESGFRLPDRSIYLMGWVGFRFREGNKEAAREPGDEVFASLTVGGELGPVSWGVTGDALLGRVPLAQGFPLPGNKRRLFQLLPTLGLRLGPGRVETTGQLPVWGRNLPVGRGISLGYRMMWGLEPPPMADLRDFFKD